MDRLVFVNQSAEFSAARLGINTGKPASCAITMKSLVVILA